MEILLSGVTVENITPGRSGGVQINYKDEIEMVYNQWDSTVLKNKKCIIGFCKNDGHYHFVATNV